MLILHLGDFNFGFEMFLLPYTPDINEIIKISTCLCNLFTGTQSLGFSKLNIMLKY